MPYSHAQEKLFARMKWQNHETDITHSSAGTLLAAQATKIDDTAPPHAQHQTCDSEHTCAHTAKVVANTGPRPWYNPTIQPKKAAADVHAKARPPTWQPQTALETNMLPLSTLLHKELNKLTA